MSTPRPTPETDLEYKEAQDFLRSAFVVPLAQFLEVKRERDESRAARNECERQYQEKVAEIAQLLSERDEAREENEAMRGAIREAHTALSLLDDCRLFHADSMDIDGSTTDYCATTLVKLQPFLP